MRVASWILAKAPSFTISEVFDELSEYYGGDFDAAEKQWTRDKERLQKLGIPLRYVDHQREYVLHLNEYYLPAIRFAHEERAVLSMAGQAALRISGNPFSGELLSALRKLRCADADAPEALALPMGRREDDLDPVRSRDVEATIKDALIRRKRVSMRYFSAWSSSEAEREVDVFGFAWRRGVWFFVGYCHLRRAVRVFYPTRVREIAVNGKNPGSPDYEIPADFDIRPFVAQKEWDYWVHAPLPATVRFAGSLAPIAASLVPSARLDAQPDGTVLAQLSVRSLGALVRQCLAWGGDAELIEPADGRARARRMLERLGAELARPRDPNAVPSHRRSSSRAAAARRDADEPGYLRMVRRFLILIPFVAHRGKVHWKEVRDVIGYRSIAELWDDLDVARSFEIPGASGETIDIELRGQYVCCWLPRGFNKPPRLTVLEAAALLTSLRALGDASGEALGRAIRRLRQAFPCGDDVTRTDTLLANLTRMLAIEEPPRSPFHGTLQDAIERRQELTLAYFAASREVTFQPVVEPVQLLVHRGHWYLEAFAVGPRETRVYRLDRISGVTAAGRTFDARIPTAEVAALFSFPSITIAWLRYSARLATYVQEHFGEVPAHPDGSFTVEWAMRGARESFLSWILGFGGECAIEHPPALRDALEHRRAVLLERYADVTPPGTVAA